MEKGEIKIRKSRKGITSTLIVISLFLILSSSVVTADVCATKADYGCVWWNPFTWAKCWYERIYDIFVCGTYHLILGIEELIKENPEIDGYKPLVDHLVFILYMFYTVAILITAIYIMILSASPSGRARGKSMLLRLIMGLVLVSLSFDIYNILLGLSQSLTKGFLAEAILTQTGEECLIAIIQINNLFLPLLIFMQLVIMFAYLSVILRYIIVIAMVVLFPLTLFLYSFELTKGMGVNFMRYTLMAIFTQPVQAIMFALMIISLNSIDQFTGVSCSSLAVIFNWDVIFAMFLAAGGFALIAISPLMMLGAMKWIGGAVAAMGFSIAYRFPRLGAAITTMGALGTGMGPEAFVTGASAYLMGYEFGRGKMNIEYEMKNQAQWERKTGIRISSEADRRLFERDLKRAEIYNNKLKEAGYSKEFRRIELKKKYPWYTPMEEFERRWGIEWRPWRARAWVPIPATAAWGIGKHVVPRVRRPVVSGAAKVGGWAGRRRVIKRAAKIIPERFKRPLKNRLAMERQAGRIRKINKTRDIEEAKGVFKELYETEGFTEFDKRTLERKYGYTREEIERLPKSELAEKLAEARIGILRRSSTRRGRFYMDRFKDNARNYLIHDFALREKNMKYYERYMKRLSASSIRKGLSRDTALKSIEDFYSKDYAMVTKDLAVRKREIKKLKSIDEVMEYRKKRLGMTEEENRRLLYETRDINKIKERTIEEIREREGLTLPQRRMAIEKLESTGEVENYLKEELNMSEKDIRKLRDGAKLDALMENLEREGFEEEALVELAEDANYDYKTFQENLKKKGIQKGHKRVKFTKEDLEDLMPSEGEELQMLKKRAVEKAEGLYSREAFSDKEKWLIRNNELYERFGDEEKATWSATEMTSQDMATKDAVRMGDEYRDLDEAIRDKAGLVHSVNLGAQLHARMLLEDYMGFGPRPSEFYAGLGPETKEEWLKRMREEEDKRIWRELLEEEE